MVNKCCVPHCQSNYKKTLKKEEYASVYKFPKNEDERNLWIKAIPRYNFSVSNYSVVCHKHWPLDATFYKIRGGNLRPKDPPSVFPNIHKISITNLHPKKRLKTKSSSTGNSILNVKLEEFKKLDYVTYSSSPKFIENEKRSKRLCCKMTGANESTKPTNTMTSAQLTSLVTGVIPPMSPAAHKGQAGRIGIVGGSLEYTGAPYFAAMTALRMGADISHIFCMREAALAIKTYSPELIVHPVLDVGDPLTEIEEWLPRLHALVLGPGLGRRPQTFATLGHILEAAKDRKLLLIIDADALFYLNDNYDVIQGYENALLTPNRVEMARLFRAVIKTDMKADDITPQDVHKVAKQLGVTICCKGANDVIATGETLIICDIQGSPRRCGGQGDVLSGAAALFYYWCNASAKITASSVPPSVLGAWGAVALTRRASSLAFAQRGRGTLTTDMLALVPQAFSSLFLKMK